MYADDITLTLSAEDSLVLKQKMNYESVKISTLAHLFSLIWPTVKIGSWPLFVVHNYKKLHRRATAFCL